MLNCIIDESSLFYYVLHFQLHKTKYSASAECPYLKNPFKKHSSKNTGKKVEVVPHLSLLFVFNEHWLHKTDFRQLYYVAHKPKHGKSIAPAINGTLRAMTRGN